MDDIKGIVCFDLDGTLLHNKQDLIPESALTAFELLKENGFIRVLSTGRDMDTHYSVRYKEMLKPDAIVHQNGNRITVGTEQIFRHYMDDGLIRRIYEFCLENHFCIGTSIGKEDFFLFPELKYKADSMFKKNVERNFVPFEEIFRREIRVTALSFAGDVVNQVPVLEEAFPELTFFPFNAAYGADVVEKEYSKAEGLKRLCGYYGVDLKDTYAFGDSHNDVPILKAAHIGIAMGNGDSAAKEAADYVTDDILNDGVFNACRYFGLI